MRFRLLAFCLAAVSLTSARAQQDPARPSGSPTSRTTTGTARGAARGPLPDPVLLDGSNQQPEKRPEYGMLGEFEIPGDDTAKGDKVGGPQNPNQPGGGGGGQPQNQAQSPPAGGQAGGMPQAAGGGGGAPPQANQTAAQAGGGGAGGGEQAPNPNGPAGGGAAGGDPNAKAEGIQVAGLQGDPSGGQGGDSAQKPKSIAIGDTAMQIKPVGNAPGVVGQAALGGSTQQMESKIGKGSGPGSQQQSGKGVEKGRTIPTGL